MAARANNCLIFCSFEVGGLPFKMAEILNKHGVRTLYVSIDPCGKGHDSKDFHYSAQRPEWDRTSLFENLTRPDRIAAKLRELLRQERIDVCLATGHRSYLLEEADIPYVYWSYGSDLDQMCFFPVRAGDYPLWRLHRYFLDRYSRQVRIECRRTLRSADAMVIAPYQYGSYAALGFEKPLRFFPHFLDLPPYEGLAREKEISRKKVERLIGSQDFFFSSARQVWAGERKSLSDNKGNDVTLRAFREYLRLKGDGDTRLVLVEKGEDVLFTRELAGRLGVAEKVFWVKEMPRPELMHFYRGARLCFGQFATPCLTFAALEPLAQGTPAASYFDWEGTARAKLPYYREKAPIIDSMDAGLIARAAAEALSDPKKLEDWSHRSWLWIKRHCTEEKFVEGFRGLFPGNRNDGES